MSCATTPWRNHDHTVHPCIARSFALSIGKARQVDRVVKALEQRQESLARAAAIIRTLCSLKRKA